MANANEKREGRVSVAQRKNKSSLDTLLESMGELTDSAAKNMSAEDLRKTRKEI
jgi:hypothetical protein